MSVIAMSGSEPSNYDVKLARYRKTREVQGRVYWQLRAGIKSGALDCCKVNGKLWLIKSQVDGYLASMEESIGRSSDAQKTEASSNDMKRIAAALEDLAVTCRQLLAAKSAEIA